MNQVELHRALARATGESIGTLRRQGFSLWNPNPPLLDCEPQELVPQMVDWDQVEADRIALAIQA